MTGLYGFVTICLFCYIYCLIYGIFFDCPSKRYALKTNVLIIEVVPGIASLNLKNWRRRGAGRRAPRRTKTKPSAC